MNTDQQDALRKVRVLINPRSGLLWSQSSMQQTLERCWDQPGVDLTYQFSRSVEDGRAKVQRAIDDGVDTILVVGGDGMVNSIGGMLVGQDVALGVIPAGSGNGFARHFNVPLSPERAAKALADAPRRRIDVGMVNDHPFFVTCGMAWDAALVRAFDKSPVRGIVPYVFAAVSEFIGYERQPFEVILDDRETLNFKDPVLFTIANLTQYGGGAQIAPQACPDDGMLELIVMLQEDMPRILANLNRLFDGTLDQVPEVIFRRFRRMVVNRAQSGPLQVDGELIDEKSSSVEISVASRALNVLVP